MTLHVDMTIAYRANMLLHAAASAAATDDDEFTLVYYPPFTFLVSAHVLDDENRRCIPGEIAAARGKV
jgi:hypothetical protein